MMLTMSRLPSDSFLPSGALLDPNEHPLSLAGHVNGHSNSVISPLVLPHSSQVSYFDDPQLATFPTSSYMHSSNVPGRSRVSSQQQQHQQQRFLSPHRSPPINRDPRSASLSPTRYQNQAPAPGSSVTSPSLSAVNASIATSPEQTSNTNIASQLRRVTLQNRRLLENWEAERTHLEANRARAEDIYKEERAIMDEERFDWIEEKAQYIERIAELERDKSALLELVNRMQPYLPNGADRGTETASIAVAAQNSNPSMTRIRSPSDGISPGTIPGQGPTMPESHPFVPLDPRMQGASPAVTPGATPPSQDKIPSIDVQEIHPDLEGIPIKARAVQKSTFMDGGSASPPPDSNRASPTGSNQDSPSRSKASPAELTKEALSAPETDRLTMHAGHTPNHSISRFSTVVSTAPNTAGSSGTTTPTHLVNGPEVGNADGGAGNIPEQQVDITALPETTDDDGDQALQEPLMLRNMPAKDEVFLRRLSDKLETLKSDNATPTVLKNVEPVQSSGPAVVAPGADGAADDEESAEKGEVDPPIKFKATSNFGTAFGSLGGGF